MRLAVHCTTLPERAREGTRPGRRRVLKPVDDAVLLHLQGTCCTLSSDVTAVSAGGTAAELRLLEWTAGFVKREEGYDGGEIGGE